MCEDASERLKAGSSCIPHIAWLAGAIAGINVVGRQKQGWEWDNFIEDIYESADDLGGIEAAEPGACMVDGDGQSFSCYDTLGGYISTAGRLCPQGLKVELPSASVECVAGLLPGFTLARIKGGFLLPRCELAPFLNLVPVRGPIADRLVKEGIL
ncbi:MAG: hypothetical protein C4K49_04940 [Candidatus Thorarchaeota archaeon]|nr:MAG: hypothetical protein C4K49_04940 [Candidatus Thorarchaeota archaeon]